MPNTLAGALAGIPGLRGQLGRRQFNQEQATGQANLAGVLMKQQEIARQQQEDQQLKGLLSSPEIGGDPHKAISALIKAGTPKSLELATKLKVLVEKPGLQQIGAGGALGPGGERIPPMERPGQLKAPPNRSRYQGQTLIQEEMQPNGEWTEFGRGPRFGPNSGIGVTEAMVTPETLEMDAWRYLTDGTLPPNMGRGIQGARQAATIRNESSKLAKEMGMDPSEIRFGHMTNKAAVTAIAQLGRARAQILQFEKTAMANADLALEQSNKVDRTGVPLINKYLLAPVKTQLLNDPEFLKLHNATETFISEYARVMGGGYGAAQTTEGAQQRAHTLLNAAHTKQQFEELIGKNGLLRREMRNREKALNDQVEEERRRLRGGLPKNPSQTPSNTRGGATVSNW